MEIFEITICATAARPNEIIDISSKVLSETLRLSLALRIILFSTKSSCILRFTLACSSSNTRKNSTSFAPNFRAILRTCPRAYVSPPQCEKSLSSISRKRVVRRLVREARSSIDKEASLRALPIIEPSVIKESLRIFVRRSKVNSRTQFTLYDRYKGQNRGLIRKKTAWFAVFSSHEGLQEQNPTHQA